MHLIHVHYLSFVNTFTHIFVVPLYLIIKDIIYELNVHVYMQWLKIINKLYTNTWPTLLMKVYVLSFLNDKKVKLKQNRTRSYLETKRYNGFIYFVYTNKLWHMSISNLRIRYNLESRDKGDSPVPFFPGSH